MNNQQAKSFVNKIFEKLCSATTTDEVRHVVENDPVLKRFEMQESMYPEIKFDLKAEDLAALRDDGILDSEGRIRPPARERRMSALEKLLYAMAWKNGDLGKERHIVAGIEAGGSHANATGTDTGLVFFQFGRYLANRSTPIIDQHVIRSFALYEVSETDEESISKLRKKSILRASDRGIIDRYERWLSSSDLHDSLRNQNGYRFHVDKVLFALGRAVKMSKQQNRGARKSTT